MKQKKMAKTVRRTNPPRRPLTPQEREDARDVAYMKHHSKGPFYSWNELCKELGYDDLVLPSRKKR